MPIVHSRPVMGGGEQRPTTMLRMILAGALLSDTSAFTPSPHGVAIDSDGGGEQARCWMRCHLALTFAVIDKRDAAVIMIFKSVSSTFCLLGPWLLSWMFKNAMGLFSKF